MVGLIVLETTRAEDADALAVNNTNPLQALAALLQQPAPVALSQTELYQRELAIDSAAPDAEQLSPQAQGHADNSLSGKSPTVHREQCIAKSTVVAEHSRHSNSP